MDRGSKSCARLLTVLECEKRALVFQFKNLEVGSYDILVALLELLHQH